MSWHGMRTVLDKLNCSSCQFSEIKVNHAHRSVSRWFVAEVTVAGLPTQLAHTAALHWTKLLALSLKENSGAFPIWV